MASGISTGGFMAAGLLQGLGQGITQMGENARQLALLEYQVGANERIHAADRQARIDAAQVAAGGREKAATIHAGAVTKAAETRAGAERDVAGIHAGAELGAANTHGAKLGLDAQKNAVWMYPDGTTKPVGAGVTPNDKATKLPAIPATIEYAMHTLGMSQADAIKFAQEHSSSPAMEKKAIATLASGILQNDRSIPFQDKDGKPVDRTQMAMDKAAKTWKSLDAVIAKPDDGEDDSDGTPAGGEEDGTDDDASDVGSGAVPGLPSAGVGASSSTGSSGAADAGAAGAAAGVPGPTAAPTAAVPAPAPVDPSLAPTPAPVSAAAPAPAAGAAGAPPASQGAQAVGNTAPAARSYTPGQTIYIKGAPYKVGPDGKSATPLTLGK